MPKLKVVGFDQDIFETALKEVIGSTVLVFPTRNSASLCEKSFYQKWCFEDVRFVSIDDLKTSMLQITAPQLMDDKRLLCLYQAMSSGMKEQFHIFGFEDIIAWGQHFFRFFEELADELIPPEELPVRCLNSGITLQDWQERFLDSILGIYNVYREFINDLGYSDNIYDLNPDRLQIIETGIRYIMVNQYYYSRLERAMITALEAAGNEVVIIFQSEEGLVSGDMPELKPLDLYSLIAGNGYRTNKIRIRETENADQMVLSLLGATEPDNGDANTHPALLIDAGFSRNAYSSLFDPGLMGTGYSYGFDKTYCYVFLLGVAEDIKAIGKSLECRYLAISNVFRHLSDSRFIGYLCPECLNRDAVIKQLMVLTAQDMIYVDIDMELFEIWKPNDDLSQLSNVLWRYFTILRSFLDVRTPEDLITLLLSSTIKPQDLFSTEELNYTDVLEQFADRIENFASHTRLSVVKDWQEIFGTGGAEIATGVLDLFIASLKTATIHRTLIKPARPGFEVSNLLDSRDLTRDRVVFFNAIEGIIPAGPEPVWLFNEAQRKALGLKTYELIREWERYYFLRLILVAREVVIYTYRSVERDVEPSSFVSELLHLKDHGAIGSIEVEHDQGDLPRLKDLYLSYPERATWLSAYSADRGLDPKSHDDFFQMPFEDSDLKHVREFSLTYYSAQQMLRSPFLWYLDYVARIDESQTDVQETLTAKFFGTLIHDYLSVILKDIRTTRIDSDYLRKRYADKAVVRKALSDLLNRPIYRYKLPQNYNWDFLRDIISDCIADTVFWFFTDFLPGLLTDKLFTLIPEQERATSTELTSKTLFSVLAEGMEYAVTIHGKADLRIETPDKYYIIDFKTGKYKEHQLIIYEWFYYLLDGLADNIRLESVFAKILEQDSVKKEFTETERNKLKEALRDRVEEIISRGYGLSSKASDRAYRREITRGDLYRVTREVDK